MKKKDRIGNKGEREGERDKEQEEQEEGQNWQINERQINNKDR